MKPSLEPPVDPADNPGVKNERGVIVGWLLKMLIGLAIGGVILYDTGSIAVNFFGLDSAADEVANVVATELAAGTPTAGDLQSLEVCRRRPTANRYCELLQRRVRKHDARLLGAHIDQQGTLKVRLRRTADTLVVSRIGFIEDWATATTEGKASTKTQ